jgi:hypothetical protein
MGAITHFRWFDLGNLTALICVTGRGNLTAAPPEETPAETARGKP